MYVLDELMLCNKSMTDMLHVKGCLTNLPSCPDLVAQLWQWPLMLAVA